MGKTKTAFVGNIVEEKKSSAELYKEKREKQAEKIHLAGLKGGQRVKVVEAEPIIEQESERVKEQEKKIKKEPRVRGKKYLESKSKVDRKKKYAPKDAVVLVKETSYSKFDGTIELHLVVKKTGLSVNLSLPYSAGKAKRVELADEKTITKLGKGVIDFDILLATAEMMPKLVPFARILGPKGLMPNPKNGTLVSDIKKAKAFGGNSLTLKTEKEAPLIHTVIGKVSQTEKELIANLDAVVKAVSEKQIERAFLKATMGPSIKLAIS